jgi:hypothetical protein
MKKIFLILFVGIYLGVGCSQIPDPTASAPTPTAAVAEAGYPSAGYPGVEYGYPSADATALSQNLVESFPTLPALEMTSGTGAVEAQFLLNGAPVSGMNFYLASFILDSEGKEHTASINPSTSPLAVSDSSGMVRFNNVPVGTYGVVLEVEISSYLLLTPEGDDGLSVTVEEQKVANLGQLDYQDLPIYP